MNPRLSVRALDPASGVDGQGIVISGGKFTVGALPGGGGSSTLDGLTDVDTATTAPVDGDTLVYNAASGLWKPAAPAAGGGGSMLTFSGSAVAAGPVANFSSGATYARVRGILFFKNAIRATSATVQTIAAGNYAIKVDSKQVWTGALTNTTGADTVVTFPATFDITPGQHLVEWQFLGGTNAVLRGRNTEFEGPYVYADNKGDYLTAAGGKASTSVYLPAVIFNGQAGYWTP